MKKQIINKAKEIAMISITTIGITMLFLVYAMQSDNRYAVASTETSNGMHYVYHTDACVEVTNIKENEVFVTYKGDEYSFYTDENSTLCVGDDIVVTFNDAMQIIECY